MGVFEMIVIVTLAGCMTGVIKHYLNVKQQRGLNNDTVKQLQSQIDRLSERMATIEKIVTDDKYRLNKEIQNL